jgi:hypothetical protein
MNADVAEAQKIVHRNSPTGLRNRSNGYSLRLAFAGSQCSEPVPTTPPLLNDTTVPGVRLPALIRRRPVPVNT